MAGGQACRPVGQASNAHVNALGKPAGARRLCGSLVHGESTPAAQPSQQGPATARRVAFGTYLPPELQRESKARCAVLGIGMQDGTAQAIRSWLEQHPV